MPRADAFVLSLGIVAGIVLSGAASATAAPPEVIVTYETGGAVVLQNDGRYGADGTAFDASDTGQDRNLAVVQRTSVELGLGRHRVVLLYAPLELATRTRFDDAFVFNDTTFAPGTVLDHRYLFDGYRASYMYDVVQERELSLGLGASLQIRNADVAFSAVDGSGFVQESNIGLVFALKARLRYAPNDCVWGQLEADAFSTFGLVDGVSGGIYDVALTLGVPVAPPLDVMFTARLLGGGAKVDDRDIDNWANFVSLSLGARVQLDRL